MTLNTIYETKSHSAKTQGIVYAQTKEDTERKWRDDELKRTDELMLLPDYPVDLTVYRQELRDYPSQPDYPNGERPTI